MEWYERDPGRLAVERELFSRFYPHARICLHGRRIEVAVRIVADRGSYLIRIEYPRRFPSAVPAAYPVDPLIKGTPHQYLGNRLCLHGDSEVGVQTTGKVIADWAGCWIRAYERWLANGQTGWPATNYAQGAT